MNQDAQQRIMGYFIEEARDHLTTIEQGLLSLRESMSDPELINELFRAAHSIKGGSAMLGLGAIQRTAHRMEDFFNIFRSRQGQVPVDQHLETLLLRGFDTLSMLLEELQSPGGLSEETSNAAIAELEPVFAETESHIYHLLSEGEVSASPPPQTETVQTAMTQTVPPLMKEMLELFKRRTEPGIREQLVAKADRLAEVGHQHQLTPWQSLVQAVRAAILEPSNDLRNVALIALRDLKQAQQAVLQGKGDTIQISGDLSALTQPPAASAPTPSPAPAMTEAQRRILGFFLEEAREHLTTIEQGLLNLKANSSDPEAIEELFRATHSIKGGAAQLGMTSIQRTAHRMEDFFSIFRQHPGQVPVDQHLESLLLQGYDTLAKLMDQLQELGYLPEDYGEATWATIEPVFQETEAHIHALRQGGIPAAVAEPAGPTPLEIALNQEIPRLLKQMLAHFKQPDQDQARAQLLQDTATLKGYGDTHGLSHWSQLLQTISTLLTPADQDLKQLALPVLRDLKQAHHALLAGQEESIQASADLLALLPTPDLTLEEEDAAAELDQWLLATEEESRAFSEPPTQEEPILAPQTADFLSGDTILEDEPLGIGMEDDLGALFSSMTELDPDTFEATGGDLMDSTQPEAETQDFDLSLEEMFELPDLEGWQDDSPAQDETTEILSRDLPGELETSNLDPSWVEAPSGEAEDFDLMPLELGDEDEMAFSELFSQAEELAAMEDSSFETPTGFPTAAETAEAEVSLSQRIGEAKADSNLADLFSEVTDSSGFSESELSSPPPDLNDNSWASDPQPAAVASDHDSEWSSLFEDLDLGESLGDEDLGQIDQDGSAADPFDLNPLATETGEEDSALFDALFGGDELDDMADSALETPLPAEPIQSEVPWSVPDPQATQQDELSFEDLFGAPFEDDSTPEPSRATASSPVDADPLDGEPQTSSDPIGSDPQGSSEWEDLLGLGLESEDLTLSPEAELEEDSFDALFGSLGDEDQQDSWTETDAATPEQIEDLDLAGFDDLFSPTLETEDQESNGDDLPAQAPVENGLGSGPDLEDMAAWFSDSGDTVLEDEPTAEGSTDTILEDDSLDFLFEETEAPTAGLETEGDQTPVEEDLFLEGLFNTDLEPVEASTPPSSQIPDPAEASFDRLDALFGDEPENESLALEATSGSLSVVDADGDGQIDLDELSQFLQEDEGTEERVDPPAEPEASSDLDLELDSLFGDDFGETTAAPAVEPAAPPATSSEPLDDLEDLAALFDEGPEARPAVADPSPSPATISPGPVSVQSEDQFEDELDAILGDISLDLDAAASPVTLTPPAAPTRLIPTPTPAPPLVTQPPVAQSVTARSSSSSRRPTAFSNQTMRVEVRHLDQINNLVGELVVNRNSMEQNQGRLRQFLDGLLVRVQQLSELGQRMQDQYDRSLLETALLASRGEPNLASAIVSGVRGSGHSSGQSFDALEMDRFTAFHALSQEIIELIVRVRESSSDIQFGIDEAEQITRQFRQVTTQLQEGLNRARMVPFSQIADRLPRAIRDLSIKTGKQAALVVDGRETSIDKAILEELYDPMTHLVNNALVHGIESPDDRRRTGKPTEGRISIKAFYQGNQSIIVVSDDGAGININKVKQKALGLGLLAQDADEDEVFNVLFHPGFSGRSAEEVDDLAGRGVGLDVVRRNINELRGSIQIDSERNKGTTFTIRLPLTLSISKAMVCVSDKALVAFPLDGVEEMLDVPQDEITLDEQGRPTIPWRDTRLHYQPLSDLLRYSRLHNRSRTEVYSITQDEGIVPIVVLQSAGQHVALQVDSFVEEQEIVIKQLRGPAAKPPGIAGATVLGNGRVLPIADIIELVDLAQGRTRRDMGRLWVDRDEDTPEVEAEHQTTVLIVDDSITVRELLSMTFNKVGYRVEQARDGQDAWEKLRGGLPCDLIFCDIEMPRMDGLELLSRLKEDESLQTKPIAMLTSRGAERHRQTARELGATAYFTKPYLEEELLNAAGRMLQGETLLSKE